MNHLMTPVRTRWDLVGGLALGILSLTLSCAPLPARKSVAKLAPKEKTAPARLLDGPSDARDCQDLQHLGRPTSPGLGCMPIKGGFVGLLGKAKTETWDDADGVTSSSVDYDLWVFQPSPGAVAKLAPGAGRSDSGRAALDRSVARRLTWPDGDSCADKVQEGGGSSATSTCSLFLVHDLDEDGSPEIVLKKYESSADAGCCTRPDDSYTYAFYSITKDALVPYARFPTVKTDADTFSVVDYDHDGRPHFYSQLTYNIPNNCHTFNGFLSHTLPGGAQALDDQTARQAAREFCPQQPTRAMAQVPIKELAAYVLCARLWGASAEQLTTELSQRCHTQESQTIDDQGQEHYRFPWQFCYHPGIECDYPEIANFCGEWVDDLASITPPFLFRQAAVAAPPVPAPPPAPR